MVFRNLFIISVRITLSLSLSCVFKLLIWTSIDACWKLNTFGGGRVPFSS